eukprot:scaffold6070_cov295-Pinguiococcus_pyrenoidosus.AAC.5
MIFSSFAAGSVDAVAGSEFRRSASASSSSRSFIWSYSSLLDVLPVVVVLREGLQQLRNHLVRALRNARIGEKEAKGSHYPRTRTSRTASSLPGRGACD